MARTVQNFKLNTRSARLKLPTQREPYWVNISQGCFVGYRRGAGTWIARYYDKAARKYLFKSLGAADDVLDSGAVSFEAAQERAREWFSKMARGSVDYTVNNSLDDYVQFLQTERAKSTAYDTEKRIDKYLRKLGSEKLNEITAETINKWRHNLVDWDDDEEAVRKQKDSANRVLTILKAALNRSFVNIKGIGSNAEWHKVKPYRDVGQGRKVFLDEKQCQRLVNACQGPLKDLVIAALCTGCRYGELIQAKAQDFDGEALSVDGKTGARDVILDDTGIRFFKQSCAGKNRRTLSFCAMTGNHGKKIITSDCLRQPSKEPSFRLIPCSIRCGIHTHRSVSKMGSVTKY